MVWWQLCFSTKHVWRILSYMNVILRTQGWHVSQSGQKPSLLPFPCLHLQGMWCTENTQTYQHKKTGVRFSYACWKLSTPSACCNSLSNINVITRRLCIAGSSFPVPKVGYIVSCTWLWLVWMSGCHRHYRYKRNIALTRSPWYFRFHSWIDLGLSRESKYKIFSQHLHFCYNRKENQKSRTSGGLVGWLWVGGVSPGAHSDFSALFLF